MVITSESKNKIKQYRSTHFGYAMTYIIITLAVLLFLNIYTSKTNQALFYNSNEATMLERCNNASTAIAELQVINTEKITEALAPISSLRVDRTLVTDADGIIIYDSNTSDFATENKEQQLITRALTGKDVFSWSLHDGAMISEAATPIISYGIRIGAVYMMELDTQQGHLLYTLQVRTFWISLLLEVVLILFSIIFTRAFSSRVRRIMESMRIIREGDYSHKLIMGGNDELTALGDEFNELVAKLQTSENKRRQFVSDASHELKTPLASIKLLSDSILQNDMDMETIQEFVADIGSEADRLTRMSEKLLLLTQTETPPENDYEITYISPTVERVVRMISSLAQQKNVSINTDMRDDQPILILEDDLYQIIFNLAENGIKYNKPGGTLTIDLQRSMDNIILTISDTGVGIPQESIGHIFERFYRVDKARSRQSGGSGLGLAIVKSIVERNNGQILVTSQPDVGTKFKVFFPIFDAGDEE